MAAPLNRFFTSWLWLSFRPRTVMRSRLRCRLPRTQRYSPLSWTSTAKPLYAQSCRLVRNRWGVCNRATSRAERIGPMAGIGRSSFTAACLRLSRNSSRRAAWRTGSRLSSCSYKCSARVLTPGSTSWASHWARLKFGYEWRCESCFHSSQEFFAALHTWAAEFARKDSFWLWLRYPFQNRFARLARVWRGHTEQELRDTFTAAVRIYEEEKYI